jgi:hypothetical protein
MPPHSATVRGTLSNPKTQEAKEKHQKEGNPTQIGDPGSLKTETSSTNPVPGRTNQDGATTSSNPHPSDPYERSPEDRVDPSGGNDDSERPHSQRVRGTLSHPDAGKQDNKSRSMLGDHVSLKAEMSHSKPTDQDRGAGLPKDADERQKVANERANAQKVSSKL